MRVPMFSAATATAVGGSLKASIVLATAAAFTNVAAAGNLDLYTSEAEFLVNAPIESTENFDDMVTPTYVKHWGFTFDEVVYEISSGSDATCWSVGYENCWYMTDAVEDTGAADQPEHAGVGRDGTDGRRLMGCHQFWQEPICDGHWLLFHGFRRQ